MNERIQARLTSSMVATYSERVTAHAELLSANVSGLRIEVRSLKGEEVV